MDMITTTTATATAMVAMFTTIVGGSQFVDGDDQEEDYEDDENRTDIEIFDLEL